MNSVLPLGHRRDSSVAAVCEAVIMVACFHDPVGKGRVLFDITVDRQAGGAYLTRALEPLEARCHSIDDLGKPI